jgi:hypothetical protein
VDRSPASGGLATNVEAFVVVPSILRRHYSVTYKYDLRIERIDFGLRLVAANVFVSIKQRADPRRTRLYERDRAFSGTKVMPSKAIFW